MNTGLSRQEATKLLVAMASLVNFEPTNATFEEQEKVFGLLGYTPAKMLLELSQPCGSLIKYCYWLEAEVSCAKHFQITKTHEGFCCSFNADQAMHVDYKVNSRSTGSANIRLSGASKYVGLSVMIDIQPENYMGPIKSYYGADVYVHSAKDFPGVSDFEGTVQPGWDVDLGVTPIPIDSSASLQQVPLMQRRCYMENEGKLQSSKSFSLNLCMSECRLRTVIKMCGCVPFYYADFNIVEAEGVPMCTIKSVNCLRHYRKYFFSLKPPRRYSNEDLSFDHGMDCDCMPSCTFLDYNVQRISSKRQNGMFVSSYFGGRNVSNYATLHVHFKDLFCVKYRREAFMTWDSLLASFGGIFGLCMGGSVLSIVELFYYFTVKPFTIYKDNRLRSSQDVVGQLQLVKRPPSSRRPSQIFRPYRFPLGYFERRNVLFRERSSGTTRKRIVVQSQMISAFEMNEIRNEKTGAIFLY
ncbi:sodium channel protein Nach-like [Toxorhynchites rutilus septentrionalis]|uniref:sodium channel protein Nach-like n=1 Tax=Toxorhynchites rutilus septentrionalis TaxID=329112 RepID=UPI00247AC41B|nr:sodium channel protein Nach-like [Toxorhynchites rutilus septentrionalis]